MHFPLLQDILILLGFSVIVVFILQRFRLPSILGFLITGVIIGPHGLSLIKAVREVEIISEIGVILLVFVIGMELSMKQLVSMRKTVIIGGLLQVGLSVLIATLIYKFFGFTWVEAVFIGFLFSLSSTAIVLKILQERNEISAPHGRNALGILIFQDIIVVPMMLITPIMAGESTNIGMAVLTLLIKSALVMVLTYVSARYLVPRLLHLIVKSNSKELFILTIITICFMVTFLTSEAGLSLALGAFLAGLIISESEYSHHATSTILPFRELFTSIFFISVGMLLDLSFFITHAGVVLLLVLLVFIIKGSIAAFAVAILKYPPRTVLLTGLALFQIGEFAFILSKVGVKYSLLSAEMNQYFLSVSIVTMLLTPFVIHYSEKISLLFISLSLESKWGKAISKSEPVENKDLNKLENHLVIIGYGINGTNVAKAARYVNIPYIIIELNPDTVRSERIKGQPIIFGDAVHQYTLASVQLEKARVVVIAISDPEATKTIVSNVRNFSQSVYIVVRTRYVKEIDDILALGADAVIPEEFETSVEIFSRVLHNYLVPIDELEHLIDSIRADNYKIFQPQSRVPKTIDSTSIPDFKIASVRLLADSGSVVGNTIGDANIRKEFGVNILAISRKGQMIKGITPDEKLIQNDVVFISGDQEHIEGFYHAVS
jgi:CPA2 family monovalent cation:H+ antiporter-2